MNVNTAVHTHKQCRDQVHQTVSWTSFAIFNIRPWCWFVCLLGV